MIKEEFKITQSMWDKMSEEEKVSEFKNVAKENNNTINNLMANKEKIIKKCCSDPIYYSKFSIIFEQLVEKANSIKEINRFKFEDKDSEEAVALLYSLRNEIYEKRKTAQQDQEVLVSS